MIPTEKDGPHTPAGRKKFLSKFHFALILLFFCGSAFGQPQIVMRVSSQPPRSVALSIRPETNGWVLLESSSDLVTWNHLANLLTTNSSVPFVDYSASNSAVRLYRVRSPSVSAAQALSLWQSNRPNHFQYFFQTVKLDAGGLTLGGTVTISNEVKTVTNVTMDGVPTNSFNSADFLTPEEIFSIIAGVEAQGAKLAHVTFDEQWNFPSSLALIQGVLKDYKISEFVNLSAAQTTILLEFTACRCGKNDKTASRSEKVLQKCSR